MKLSPGGAGTGFLICFVFALLAQCGVLFNGLVWDDPVLIGADERVRELSFVVRCFGASYFGPLNDNEMYRPVVNASLAIDWWLSGSGPGDVHVLWFHFVNLVLHAANAGLVYLFLAHVVDRALGAPLLGAVLWAVHPIAVEPTSWIVGRCDLLAALFGLGAGILLLRSVKQPRLLWGALACYGVSLFAKASAAPIPLVCALVAIAYRGLPPRRLLGKRHLIRFGSFVVPALIWLVARAAVLGAPFPVAGGRRWHPERVDWLDRALGIGRATVVYLENVFLPVRLCGDYAADPAASPHMASVGWSGPVGLVLLVGLIGWSVYALRKRPRIALPVLAFFVLLVPVLQLVPIGAILADRFLYLPLVFPCLLVGEGTERLFERFGRAVVPIPFLIFVLLGTLSHLRAPAWTDDITFNRDVLVTYPGARSASHRLALALSETGDPDDRAEARELLTRFLALSRPDEELALLGAMALEDGDLAEAEHLLLAAQDAAGGKARLGAHIRYNLAVLYRRKGQIEAARILLAEALERLPELPQARRMLAELE